LFILNKVVDTTLFTGFGEALLLVFEVDLFVCCPFPTNGIKNNSRNAGYKRDLKYFIRRKIKDNKKGKKKPEALVPVIFIFYEKIILQN
jgi:hypothetical protein